MLTSLTYANADGTRTAIVERCDSGDALFLWSVTCRDYGQSDHCLTGYLHFCQRIARRWVQQGHPPAGAAPGGRAVSPAHGGRTMMTEQRLQEIERRSTQGWRADWTETLEAVAEIRRLRAEVEQAQQELTAERAEQEAVTAERNEAVQGLRDCHMLARRALAAATRDGTAKHLPHILRICERQAPEGTQFTSFLRDEAIAQSPALPPLPEGWVREGVRDIILYRSHDRYTGVDGHVPPGGQVSVHAEGLRVSTTHVPVADLLIVLRHAEAAHLTLKEGK